MKKLIYLLLIAFSLFSTSCSTVEESARQSEPKVTFVLNANEQLSLVAIKIKDAEGQILNSYNYTNVQDVSLDITSGVEIVVYTVDEDELEYTYKILNSNGSIQLQGSEEGAFNHTINKYYNL
jgi:hypothetical protein